MKKDTTHNRHWWQRIDISKGVSDSNLSRARDDGENHDAGKVILPNLSYTEKNPLWVLLYEQVKRSQINPKDIHHMHRADLEYLAGMNDRPPGLSEIQSAKLRENVARATHELNRRNAFRIGVTSALIGALIGAAATLASGLLKSL